MTKVNIVEDTDKKNLKNEYQTAVETLQSHIDFSTAGTTQAQVVNALVVAVKYHAKVLLFILKFVAKKSINN